MIERIISKLNSIPSDKVFHFAGGVILFALAIPFFIPEKALAVVFFVGAGKEVYDSFNRNKHTPDIYDLLATMLGGCVAMFCTYF